MDEKSKGKMPLTHPKTPQLMTKRRCRSNAVPGQVDMEEKVVEEMKRYIPYSEILFSDFVKPVDSQLRLLYL